MIGETTEREGGGGPTVLVGVKFDGESKELLTWALVKVAQPGDNIIALHILDTATGIVLLTSHISPFIFSFNCFFFLME